jgi:hypothetical protein
MAGFIPLQSWGTEHSRPVTISSLTLATGDLLEWAVGTATATEADANTEHWQKKFVCMEPATSSDTEVLAMQVLPGMLFEVESANDSDSADNGDRMLLTDKNTVNNTGTDSTAEEACFIQFGVLGAASDRRIYGEIVYGSGVNPDAA